MNFKILMYWTICIFIIIPSINAEEEFYYNVSIDYSEIGNLSIRPLDIINLPVLFRENWSYQDIESVNDTDGNLGTLPLIVDLDKDGLIDRLGYRTLLEKDSTNVSQNKFKFYNHQGDLKVFLNGNCVFNDTGYVIVNDTLDITSYISLSEKMKLKFFEDHNTNIFIPDRLFDHDILDTYWFLNYQKRTNIFSNKRFFPCSLSYTLCDSPKSISVLEFGPRINSTHQEFKGFYDIVEKGKVSTYHNSIITLVMDDYLIIFKKPDDFVFHFGWRGNSSILSMCSDLISYKSNPDLFGDFSVYFVYEKGINPDILIQNESNYYNQIISMLNTPMYWYNMTFHKELIKNQSVEISPIKYEGWINKLVGGTKSLDIKIKIEITQDSSEIIGGVKESFNRNITPPKFKVTDYRKKTHWQEADYDPHLKSFTFEDTVTPIGKFYQFPIDDYKISIQLAPSEFINYSHKIPFNDWQFNAQQYWKEDKLEIMLKRSFLFWVAYIISLIIWAVFCFLFNKHLTQPATKVTKPQNWLAWWGGAVGIFIAIISIVFVSSTGFYLISFGTIPFIIVALFPVTSFIQKYQIKKSNEK